MYCYAILCEFIQFALSYSASVCKRHFMGKKNPSASKEVILTSSFAPTAPLLMAAAALMLSITASDTAATVQQQQGMTNATAA